MALWRLLIQLEPSIQFPQPDEHHLEQERIFARDLPLACGCDDNNDNSYLDSVIGNGSFNGLNKTLVNVANVNGTKTVVLNGTLPNGTDTTASSSSSSSSSTSGASSLVVGESAGLWALGAFVGGMLWML
ncbi:uncharacterized protein KY384_001518 [Bacidia gigantensis]|uniref:uncharacterized protein n=1 Tax=Bacidia gigantensis TaxID=2732470 RepID=UPI001D0500A5|nr:uncharacterized protein KY384_001518 [Bacidia gigantensis]KAG8533777.1 hypothetical protein KY384_001518 [Bacidia gigantensis]